VPFRMTPNIKGLIGEFSMQGNFVPGFASAASGICAYEKELSPVLHLLLRDDIVSWYTSKSTLRNDSKTQELEHQLMDRVKKNVSLVQGRLTECCPREYSSENDVTYNPADQKVRDLIEWATASESLGMMPYSYKAWV